MRKTVIILSIFALVSHSIRSQNKKYEAEKAAITDFLIKHIAFRDGNPTHQEAADEVNSFLIKVFEKQYTVDQIPDLITQALQLFYKNSIGEFDDSPDFRRMTTRRSMCFLALAFLSDKSRYLTFLADARNTLNNIEDFANSEMLLIVNMVELYKTLGLEFALKSSIKDLISRYQDDLKSKEQYTRNNFAAEYREILSKILKSLQ